MIDIYINRVTVEWSSYPVHMQEMTTTMRLVNDEKKEQLVETVLIGSSGILICSGTESVMKLEA